MLCVCSITFEANKLNSVLLQVAAKAAHVQTVKVANWLNKPQRFKVVVELQQADPATQLTAPPYVDVAGLAEKDCKLHFHAHTEGQTTGTITFLNQTSGEYILYNLAFTAGPSKPQGTIRLEGPVRSRVSHLVSISNPLPTEIVMAVVCSNKQVLVPANLTVAAGSTANLEVTYRPLLVAEAEASLKLSSKALGVYDYQLKLKGAAAGPDGSLAITVPLGGSETQVRTPYMYCTCWFAIQAARIICIEQMYTPGYLLVDSHHMS